MTEREREFEREFDAWCKKLSDSHTAIRANMREMRMSVDRVDDTIEKVDAIIDNIDISSDLIDWRFDRIDRQLDGLDTISRESKPRRA